MLFLWLLGLAAGAANACQFGAQAAARVHLPVQASGQWPVPSHHGEPADAPAAQHAPALLASVHCQDSCAQSAPSMLPLKSALDNGHAAALIAAARATVLPVAAFVPAASSPPRRQGAPALRILIAFLRLAL